MQKTEKEFIEILKQNQGIIYKVANSYAKTRTERDDLVQEISIQLWNAWPKYKSEFKISTWMYKIALNVAISFFRSTSKYLNKHTYIPEDSRLIDESQDVELSENIKELYYYISQLNELNKALILLYLEKYNYEEIAETIGITVTNVSTKISRIKKELKEKFKN